MSNVPNTCKYCGYELPPDSRFCEKCGRPVTITATPEPVPPPVTDVPAPAGGGSKKWLAFGLVGAVIAGVIICAAVGLLGWYFFQQFGDKTGQVSTEDSQVVPVIETSKVPAAVATATTAALQPATLQPTAVVLPVTAVPVNNTQTFASHGISFAYDTSLATDFDIELVEEQSGGAVMEWEAMPQHLQLIVRGYPQTESSLQAGISLFPVEDYYRVNPNIGDNHATLQQMLMMRRTDDLPDPLPFFLFWNAGQVIAVKVAYIDFEGGSGVRYLTQYASDVYPINNLGLFYSFQGLTDDGKTLISAVMPVSNPILPDPQIILADPAFYDEHETYLEVVKADLTAQPDDSFSPSLELLDELFAPLQVEEPDY